MRRKTIKTQGDFEKVMSALQSELRSVIKPLRQEEDELRVRLSELNVQRSEKIIALQEQRTHWEEVMHLRDIREEKLACLAEGRKLKLELSRLGGGFQSAKCSLGASSRSVMSWHSHTMTRWMS